MLNRAVAGASRFFAASVAPLFDTIEGALIHTLDKFALLLSLHICLFTVHHDLVSC